MDSLRDVVHFVEVARARSFVRAAETLGVPTSTLSRRIAEHEAAIGAKLFNRTTRRVELTEAGILYLARCEQIVEAARAAREEIQNLHRRPRGLLRVSMSPDFGATFLAPVIATFRGLYPDIALQLDLSPRQVDLLGEGFDLAVRMGVPADPTLVGRRLVYARRGLYASPDFLARTAVPRVPGDLSDLECLAVGPSAYAARWILRRGTDTQEVQISGRVIANTPGMVLQLAASGLGIAAVDATMAAPLVRSRRLKQILPDWEIAPVPVYVLTPSQVDTLKVRVFIDHLCYSLKKYEAR